MWDEPHRQRFQELRQRQLTDPLTDAEAAELALLGQDLERVEAAYLTPATRRLRSEREEIETQNSRLQALINRREELVRRLRDFLAAARAERSAIEGELEAVLTEGRGDLTKTS